MFLKILLLVVLVSPSASAISFDWAWDDHVEYYYSASPVSRVQYQEFLNASAEAAADPCGFLWNPEQGITRTGSPGAYVYSGGSGAALTHVTLIGAMQFINWLQTGQGLGDPTGPNYFAGYDANSCTFTYPQGGLWVGNYPTYADFYTLGGYSSSTFNFCTTNRESPLSLHLVAESVYTNVPEWQTKHKTFYKVYPPGGCTEGYGGAHGSQRYTEHSEAGFHVAQNFNPIDSGDAPHNMTDEEKRLTKANVIGLGGVTAVAGPVAALCTIGVITAPVCSLPLGVMTALTSSALWTQKTILDLDPPDINYREIVAVVPPSFPPMTTSSGRPADQVALVNKIMQSEAWLLGLGRAIITSINRASTARADGETYWTQQQINAIKNFIKLQGFFLRRDDNARRQLVNLLIASGEPTVVITAEQIEEYQARLLDTGWTGEEKVVLASLGMTGPDRLAARQYIGSQSFVSAGSYPTALNHPSLRQSADGIVELLPEPNSFVGLATSVGFLVMLSRNRKFLWVLLVPTAQVVTLMAYLYHEDSRFISISFDIVWLGSIVYYIWLASRPKVCRLK